MSDIKILKPYVRTISKLSLLYVDNYIYMMLYHKACYFRSTFVMIVVICVKRKDIDLDFSVRPSVRPSVRHAFCALLDSETVQRSTAMKPVYHMKAGVRFVS